MSWLVVGGGNGDMRPFFKDDDFNFLTEIALGSVYRQAADVGEVDWLDEQIPA